MKDLSTQSDRLIAVTNSLKFGVPYFLISLFFLLDHISYGGGAFNEIMPSLTLMAIFYWSIYRPGLIPLWFVFFLGVWSDLLADLPLGLTALLFVLIQWFISSQRKLFLGQPFVTMLLGFVVVSSAYYLVHWAIFALILNSIPSLSNACITIILSLLVFPCVVMLIRLTHKALPDEDRVVKK